jgi:hypothetical protein
MMWRRGLIGGMSSWRSGWEVSVDLGLLMGLNLRRGGVI